VAAANDEGFTGAAAGRGGAHGLEAAVEYLRSADPVLGKLIDVVGDCNLELRVGPGTFAALARSVVYQQLSGKAAAAIFARLCALGSGADATGADCPTPEVILASPAGALRAVGMSAAKERSLRDMAERTLNGSLPAIADLAAMDDEAVIAELGQVRGVGRWTAEMFLIFSLGRPDVLSGGDQGLRRGFQLAFGLAELPTPQELLEHGKLWAPYRSVASWYLWRSAETKK
jgi:3-methyladenine DNA glycosylase/8-oxoguanine DNA glycosylase